MVGVVVFVIGVWVVGVVCGLVVGVGGGVEFE